MARRVRRLKKVLAACLTVCMMIVGFEIDIPASQDQPQEEIETGEVSFQLDAAELNELARNAVKEGIPVSVDDMDTAVFKNLIQEKQVLYELNPEPTKEDSLVEDAAIRIFLKAEKDQAEYTGKEELVFLFSNTGEASTVCTLVIGDKITLPISLGGMSVEETKALESSTAALETSPVESGSEAETSLEESQTEGDTEPETSQPEGDTEPEESQAEGDTKPETSQTEGDTEPETSQAESDTKPETSQAGGDTEPETSPAEGDIEPETSRAESDAKPETSQAEIVVRPEVSQAERTDTQERDVRKAETAPAGESIEKITEAAVPQADAPQIKEAEPYQPEEGREVSEGEFIGILYPQRETETAVIRAFVMPVSQLGMNGDTALLIRHVYMAEEAERLISEETVPNQQPGTVIVPKEYVKETGFYYYDGGDMENVTLAAGANVVTLVYDVDPDKLLAEVQAELGRPKSKGRSANVRAAELTGLGEGTVGAIKTASWTDIEQLKGKITLSARGVPAKKPVDVMLILDASGSMKGEPAKAVSMAAMKLLTELLPKEDASLAPADYPDKDAPVRVGVQLFGSGLGTDSGTGRYCTKFMVNQWNYLDLGASGGSGNLKKLVEDEYIRVTSREGWGTNYGLALQMTKTAVSNTRFSYWRNPVTGEVVESDTTDRDCYIIFMSDGCDAEVGGYDASGQLTGKKLQAQMQIKNLIDGLTKGKNKNVKVYTVGVSLDKLPNRYDGTKKPPVYNERDAAGDLLRSMANPADRDRYFKQISSGNLAAVNDIFLEIFSEFRNAGTEAVIVDEIHPDYEVLTDEMPELRTGKAVYDAENHTITWRIGNLVNTVLTLDIPVRLTGTSTTPGGIQSDVPYYTNKNAAMTYTDLYGAEQTVSIPSPFLATPFCAIDIRYCMADEDGYYLTKNVAAQPGDPEYIRIPEQQDVSYRILLGRDQQFGINSASIIGIHPSKTSVVYDGKVYAICMPDGKLPVVTHQGTTVPTVHTFYFPMYLKVGAAPPDPEGTETTYKVEYYYQNSEDGQFKADPDKTETGNAKVGDEVSINADAIDSHSSGYAVDRGHTGELLKSTIASGGTTVFKVFLKLQYKITYTRGSHGNFKDTVCSADWNAPVPAYAGTPSTTNYKFIGWEPKPDNYEKVTENLNFVAQWERVTPVPYAIEYYYQNADGQFILEKTDRSLNGSLGENVTIDLNNTAVQAGYVVDRSNTGNILEGIIREDGTLVLRVFVKKEFTVAYSPGTQGTFAQQIHKTDWNSGTPGFDGTPTGKTGYTFTGWSPDVSATVIQNADYVAQWKQDSGGGSGGGGNGGGTPVNPINPTSPAGPGPGETPGPVQPVIPDNPDTWPEFVPPQEPVIPPVEPNPDGSVDVLVPVVPPGSDVIVKDSGNNIVFRGSTDETGRFHANLANGSYILLAIDDAGVPLGQMTFTIRDTETPLGSLPKTGEYRSSLWLVMIIISGMLLLMVTVRKRRLK